jgi:hypothetical protein
MCKLQTDTTNAQLQTLKTLRKYAVTPSGKNVDPWFRFPEQPGTRIMGTSQKHQSTLTIISGWILLRTRNVSGKICREIQNTHFIIHNNYSRKSCRLWDNVEKYGRTRQATDDNIIRRMRFACWITKARIQKHAHNIILFPRQQKLCERALHLRYKYSACLVLD